MTKTYYGNINNNATLDGTPVLMVCRYGRNGIKYVWLYPSQKKLDDLVYRYGVEQWGDGAFIENNGTITRCDCVWLYTY